MYLLTVMHGRGHVPGTRNMAIGLRMTRLRTRYTDGGHSFGEARRVIEYIPPRP